MNVLGDANIQVLGTNGGWAYGIYLSAGSSATISNDAVIQATTAEGVTGYTAGIVYFGSGDKETPTTLTVTGGTISGEAYGLSDNGSASYSKVTISGGEISGDWGIFHPEMGTLTISDGTITGSTTGIEMRSGELIVTGGTITSKYTDAFTTENNNSGTTVVGAGIAVSQHTTDNAITVEITGGTISGIYGVYEINYNTDNTSTVSVTVTEDEDGKSATITTTDSTQGAAVYSTSLDDTSTSTAKNNNTSVELSAGTYNTDVSAYTTDTSAAVATTTTTDEDGNTTTTYTVVKTVENAVALLYDASGSLVYSYDTLTKAANAVAADNYKIVLIKDVSDLTLTYKSSYSATLDLQGYDIICTDSSSYPYSPIYVTNGSLTVIDSTAAEGEVGDSVLSTTKGNGAVFVIGGNVTIKAGNYISYSNSGQTVQISAAATSSVVTIDNGTFTSVGYGMQVQAGTLNINGGTIASSVATIDSDETTYTPAVRGAVLVRALGTSDSAVIPYLNITGGCFTSIYNESGMIVYAVDKTTDASTNPVDFTDYISISGGYYDMNNYSVARYLVDGYEVASNTGDNSTTYPYVVQETEVASGSIGYGYATIDTDGNVKATVMGTYTDLSGAIYRADLAYDNVSTSGDYYAYVQLGSKVDLSLTSSVGSSSTYPRLIIDLGGAAISSSATVFQVGAGSELILLDSAGTAKVTSSVKTAGTVRNAGGTLAIYGGTYINTDTENSYSPVVYNAVSSSNNGISTASDEEVSTVIYGGTFESKGRAIHLNLGTATLNGGTYTAKALVYAASESNTVSYPDGYGAFVTNTDSTSGTTYYTWVVKEAVASVNGTNYGAVADAVAASSSGDTITLLADTTEDVVIPESANVTLDLNGKTLTNATTHTIVNYGTLTITDSSTGGTVDCVTHACAALYNYGTITEISGGTFTRSAEEADPNSTNSWYTVVNVGTITKISGGTFTTADGKSANLGNRSAVFRNGDGTTGGTIGEISGGIFIGAANIIKNESGSTITLISGGTFTMDNTVNGWYGGNVMINNYGTIGSITGGMFSAFGTGVSANESYTAYNKYFLVTYSDVTVSGITVDMDGAQNVMVNVKTGATISITSGSYAIDADDTSMLFMTADGAYVAVSGGTYSTEVAAEYCADGYIPTATTTGGVTTYGVTPFYIGVSDGNSETVPASIASGYDTSTLYVKVSAENISNYSTEKYPTTSLTYTSDSSVDSGSYIFAGWYTLDGDSYKAMNVFPKSEEDTTEATVYYAKFVDKNALKIYCYYTPKGATDSGPANNAWRFISSLESGNPQALLFKIGGTVYQARTFYTSSSVGAVKTTYKPADFSSASQYVASYSVLDSTDALTSYTVQCGWLTLDGTAVYGSAYIFDASSCTAATALSGTEQ